MNPRTHNALLALGFPTDLIERIDGNAHTVAVLRQMSRTILSHHYGDQWATAIAAKVQRKPIHASVLDSILSRSLRCCCYCVDGISTRPYQIHHIDEYYKTQDNSEENLLLVCPTHHEVLHANGVSSEAQRDQRRRWYAIAEVADACASRGIAFPFTSFEAMSVQGESDVTELTRGFHVSAATACRVVPPTTLDSALGSVDSAGHCVITGRSGAGKTTAALAVGATLAGRGHSLLRYRHPTENPRLAMTELLLVLQCAVRPLAVIVEDVNRLMSREEFATLVSSVRAPARLIATWTDADRPGSSGQPPTSQVVHVTWDTTWPHLRSCLLEEELRLVAALRGRERSPWSIGLGHLDRDLEQWLDWLASRTTTVSQFCLLLREGTLRARVVLERLADADRADVPVLLAAAEQIAGFERHVTPAEVEGAIRELGFSDGLPDATASWIQRVFAEQARAYYMRESRSAYTTVHRDWARALLSEGCSLDHVSASAKAILRRDIRLECPDPDRLACLLSWVGRDSGPSQVVQSWASEVSSATLARLIGEAAERGIRTLGYVSRELHLLQYGTSWESRLRAALVNQRPAVHAALVKSGVDDWYSLAQVQMLMNHLCPEEWDAAVLAIADQEWAVRLNRTGGEGAYHVSWVLGHTASRQPEWRNRVGGLLDCAKLIEAAHAVKPGELRAIDELYGIVRRFAPCLMRSTVRGFVEASRHGIARTGVADLQVPAVSTLFMELMLLPEDGRSIFDAVPIERIAAEFVASAPRHWVGWAELALYGSWFESHFAARLFALLDWTSFWKRASSLAATYPYELRCLVHLLSHASPSDRQVFTKDMFDAVLAVARTSESEREPLSGAFRNLDPALGETMCQLLSVKPDPSTDPDNHPGFEEHRKALRARDLEGDDYRIDDVVPEMSRDGPKSSARGK